MNYKEKLITKFEKVISKELDKVSKIENKEERMYKLEVLYKVHQVLTNFNEIEPVIKKHFDNKSKFKGEER